jgi:hypothetical protein
MLTFASVRGNRPGKLVQLEEYEIKWLCSTAREIFMGQPILLELEAPIKVCGMSLSPLWLCARQLMPAAGDLHGQYYDLLRLFEYGGFPPDANYLFLGDYVDRGKQSLETICLLLAYKIKYPENFFLLRGNHEVASTNRIYGFFDECGCRLARLFSSVSLRSGLRSIVHVLCFRPSYVQNDEKAENPPAEPDRSRAKNEGARGRRGRRRALFGERAQPPCAGAKG